MPAPATSPPAGTAYDGRMTSAVIPALPDRLDDGNLVLVRHGLGQDVAELFRVLPAQVWEHIPGGAPEDPAALATSMDARLQAVDPAATWVVLLDGKVVGTTSHLPNDDPSVVEVGATFMSPETWGTGLNGRVKKLMVDAARQAGAQWIRFRTDERNARSAAAIRKLGAADDGTFPEDIIRPDGSRRTSLLFRLDL